MKNINYLRGINLMGKYYFCTIEFRVRFPNAPIFNYKFATNNYHMYTFIYYNEKKDILLY